MRTGRSLNAAARKRIRWHLSPAPRANVVKPLFFVGRQSDRPDAPCFKCGSAGECRHREVEYA
jgi:hypothetical protein